VTELPIRLQMCGYTCRSRDVTRVIPKIIIPDLSACRDLSAHRSYFTIYLKIALSMPRNSVFYRRKSAYVACWIEQRY